MAYQSTRKAMCKVDADVLSAAVLQYVPVDAGYEAKDGENVLDSIDVPAEAK